MTREQFIERHRRHCCGVIANGSAQYHALAGGQFESVKQLGEVLVNLNDEAVKLLGQLYDAMVPTNANGTPTPLPARK